LYQAWPCEAIKIKLYRFYRVSAEWLALHFWCPASTSFQNIDDTCARVLRLRLLHFSLKGNTMTKGTVKWFNSQKGFGFIQPEGGGPDVFVHISAVERSGLHGLNEGQQISFEIVADRRTGKSAADRLQVV